VSWDLMKKSELLFDKHKIKPLLGVIPNNKDSQLLTYPKRNNFWDQVRNWRDKGWEIAMHGNTHVYDKMCKKDDYFNYGGGSEFFGHSLETQITKIQNGLKKFNDEKIKIRTFFAPNHTFDKNTLIALKKSGINVVIDGYGLMPYTEHDIKFIPQLFLKALLLPFGIQSTQIHLNYMKEKDFDNFVHFVEKNFNRIISYDQTIKKINNNLSYKFVRVLFEKILKIKRILIKKR